MSASSTLHFVTYAEYLAGEGAGDVKHEWLNGMVYAMSRGSPARSSASAMASSSLGTSGAPSPMRKPRNAFW